MKKRNANKIERKKRESIHKILDLVLDVNGLDERARDLTGDKPTAFFEFSGHTAGITVQLYENGWSEKAEKAGVSMTHYIDRKYGDSLESVVRKLAEVQNGL